METDVIVMSMTVFMTEVFKRLMSKISSDESSSTFWAPFAAIVIGAMLNLGFVLLLQVTNYSEFWTSFEWRTVLLQGIDNGMKAGGLYGIGKVVVKKYSNPNQNWSN